jgi:hypothetical protein
MATLGIRRGPLPGVVTARGNLRAQIHVKELAPRFIMVPLEALPRNIGKGDEVEVVVRRRRVDLGEAA